ncbi:MAG: HD domain-containing protein [Lachnospiraceae bacterium]|nr:HD domain-containing protein [Lachnospiraceae bacterium]
MEYVKLQIGCLVIVLYLIVTYVRETYYRNIPCNRFFDALMVVVSWEVVFDGLTAWTVNHLDIVPVMFNRFAHLIFLVLVDLIIIVTAMYMFEQTVGFGKKNKKRKLLFVTPGALSIVLIVAGMSNLEYVHGVYTNYSMGWPVYVCYGSVVIHYGFVLVLLLIRHRYLPSEKKVGIFSFIGLSGVFITLQIIFPEILMTSLLATTLLLGIYMFFENPYIRKLTIYNSKMVEGFASMIESRDDNTGGHVKRTQAYVNLMLHHMRHDRKYRDVINKDYLVNVSNAAPLHDIGKIATPDVILQKPGKLTDEEYSMMKQHAACGGDMLRTIFKDLDDPEFLQIAYEVARHHHEKYNGKGYPDGLSGNEIPLHARIMAIADVFDAVSQKRCYRDAMSLDASFEIIEKGSGTDFDPVLTKIFLDAREEVEALVKDL